MDYCFLDLETTGFEPTEDSIIEISFVRFKDGKLVSEMDQVIMPDKSPLNDFVSHLTGITQSEIDKTGQNMSDLKSEIETKIGDSVIIGHNIDFDINFLLANDIDIQDNPRIDTHELARILLPQETSFALEVLTEKYGFAHENAHRAMSDVLASKDLFELLLERIKHLPPTFFASIKGVLETRTDWHAKQFFLEAASIEPIFQFAPTVAPDLPANADWKFPPMVEKGSVSLPIGNNVDSGIYLKTLAKQSNQKTLIISPKLNFFTEIKKFPTPEVIFDPAGLDRFLDTRKQLNDAEITFYLKCQLRHALGLRGLEFFDLFFKERELWKEVCLTELASPLYQVIVAEKIKEKDLAISPEAFFRLESLDVFTDRLLILDETEMIAEKCLFAPTQTLSLLPALDGKDESLSTKAQFLVTRFCQEVIEPKIGHKITPFPQRVLLDSKELLTEFYDQFLDFIPTNETDLWRDFCTAPPDQSVRWVTYFPANGNLELSYWHPTSWRDIKGRLSQYTKIITHRQGNNSIWPEFLRIFLGINEVSDFIESGILFDKKLIIPENLISHKSPDFNDFCAKTMAEIYQKSTSNVAFNFTSLDTLRGCFDKLTALLSAETNMKLIGEKTSGGDGKVLQILKANQDKKIAFCCNRMLKPALNDFDWEVLVIQKFPFGPPHPLLEKIDQGLKQSGKNFWNYWTIPHLVAQLSRRVGNFPTAEKVYFLDPRENSRWGKEILEKVF